MSGPYTDRECEVCGRKGGGRPDGGLENVVIAYGHQLCGTHLLESQDWKWRTREAPLPLSEWIEAKKGRAA